MYAVEFGSSEQVTWYPLRRGIEQATLFSESNAMSGVLNRIQNGHEVRPHSHPSEQIVLILAGECDYYVGGRSYRLTAGSWLTIPPNVEHYIYVYDSLTPCLQMSICVPAYSSSESVPADAAETVRKAACPQRQSKIS